VKNLFSKMVVQRICQIAIPDGERMWILAVANSEEVCSQDSRITTNRKT